MATDEDGSTPKVVSRTHWWCVGIVAIASLAVPLATRHLGAVGLFVGGIGVGLAQAIAGAGATASRVGGVLSLTILFAATVSLLRLSFAQRRPKLTTVLIVFWTVAYLVLTLAVPEYRFYRSLF